MYPKSDTVLVVENPETGERWTIRRAVFERHVEAGEIQRVEPNWQPADEPVVA